MSVFSRQGLLSLLCLALGTLVGPVVGLQAQTLPANKEPAVIFFKDGFSLHGIVKQDQTVHVDPFSRTPVRVPRGYYYLEDHARRMFFSHHYVEHTQPRPFDIGEKMTVPSRDKFFGSVPAPPMRAVLNVGPWDGTWDRRYQFRGPERNVSFTQHLHELTPTYAHMASTAADRNRYSWSAAYLTRELGPDMVLGLLQAHPKLKETPDLDAEERLERRLRIQQFFVDAGWIDQAEQQLEAIRKDFPDAKSRLDDAAEKLRKVIAYFRWDEIKLARQAGRHQDARKLLAAFPEDAADGKLLTDTRTLRDQYDAAEKKIQQVRSHLSELPAQVPDRLRRMMTEAAAAISTEVGFDHFLKDPDAAVPGRLEPFLSQANRAERLKAEDKPGVPPEQLLSLAVTGWLLGSAAAETKPESAERLWRARQLVLSYLNTPVQTARAKLLADYMKDAPLSAEEMVQLIAHLPPPEPDAVITTRPVEKKLSFSRSNDVTYQVVLPPEYHPSRPYPVLLALHNAGEEPSAMIERWQRMAARHGYILAAPQWDKGLAEEYDYAAERHHSVLATMRDLCRRFRVDSDRVFLTGFAEGANMAYDVGLAHPDLFAGVLPFAGQPRYHANMYEDNGRVLPFYIVWGDRMGGPDDGSASSGRVNLQDGNVRNYKHIEKAIPRGSPVIGIQYKGRGVDWFAGELAEAFDWMNRKKRTDLLATYGLEFRTMRSIDNRFYLLSTNSIYEGCLSEGPKETFRDRPIPAVMSIKIGAGNEIGLTTAGLHQVSLWFAPGTIDFDKELLIRINLKVVWRKRKVEPSLAILLEDLFERGDRQRLFIARIDF